MVAVVATIAPLYHYLVVLELDWVVPIVVNFLNLVLGFHLDLVLVVHMVAVGSGTHLFLQNSFQNVRLKIDLLNFIIIFFFSYLPYEITHFEI